MKSLSYCTLLIIAFCFTSNVDAQRWKARRYEAVFGIGSANQYGDIGGTMTEKNLYGLKDIQLAKTRPSMAFGARYKINALMATKLNLYTGFLTGSDVGSKNAGTRDYSFKSTIFEYSLQYEYYIISEVRELSSGALYNRKGMVNDYFNINVYLFAGFGGVFSNAKVTDYSNANEGGNDRYKEYDSKGYLIRDLYTQSTEFDVVSGLYSIIGTENNRSKSGLVFPVGIGAKYIWTKDWSFGVEFGRRFTNFDKLDGYSAQNPGLKIENKSKDVYDFMTFSVIYRIPTDRRGLPIFGNRAAVRE